jgi:hypothetical protein
MKFSSGIFRLCILMMIVISCKKSNTGDLPKNPPVHRTIQFRLYTNKDVSNDQHNISFSLFIENSKHEVLWDSTLAPMKEKDIPGFEGKIVVQKLVPNDDNSLLKVGFHYIIQDVGYASHDEPDIPGQSFKVVDFNF